MEKYILSLKDVQKERLEWVDRMRGLAILSVVIQHLTYYCSNEFIYHKFIGISNMALFFFISGFILDRTARINNMKDALNFMCKKTFQLMIPFLVWSLIVSRYFFQNNWQLLSFQSVIDEFKNPHLWFLLTLYGYCFLFVISRLLNNHKSWGGVNILFWSTTLFLLFIGWYKWGIFDKATLYLIYFATGVILSQRDLIDKIFQNGMLSTIALFFVFLGLGFWNSGETSILNILLKMVMSFSVILITYNLCFRLSWNKYWDKFILSCGTNSLVIYVAHWGFLKIFDPKIMIVQNELVAFLPMLLFAILISGVCILFSKIIRLFPTVEFFLFGNFKGKLFK